MLSWAEHVVSKEENYKSYTKLIGKSEVNGQDLGVGVRIILSYRNRMGGLELDMSGS